MVVGKDVQVEDILRFLGKTLVGRFYGKVVQMDSLNQ
jgi:hypothetical protein